MAGIMITSLPPTAQVGDVIKATGNCQGLKQGEYYYIVNVANKEVAHIGYELPSDVLKELDVQQSLSTEKTLMPVSQMAVINALQDYILKESIVQGEGQSAVLVASQKLVTDIAVGLRNLIEETRVKYDVVQGTGISSEDVMSQKAVTDALNVLADLIEDYRVKYHVVQDTGTSTANVMSQKAVTDALNALELLIEGYRVTYDVVQTSGTSTENVMSQNVVTTMFNNIDAVIAALPTPPLVVTTEGDSTELVMSQKGVTDALESLRATISAAGGSVEVSQTTGASPTAVMSQKAVTEQLEEKLDATYASTITANNNAITSLVPKTTRVNGKALQEDITLDSSDVGAVPRTFILNGKPMTGESMQLDLSDLGSITDSFVIDEIGLATNKASSARAVAEEFSKYLTRLEANENLVPKTTEINGKALQGDINLTPADLGAVATSQVGVSVVPLVGGKIPSSFLDGVSFEGGGGGLVRVKHKNLLAYLPDINPNTLYFVEDEETLYQTKGFWQRQDILEYDDADIQYIDAEEIENILEQSEGEHSFLIQTDTTFYYIEDGTLQSGGSLGTATDYNAMVSMHGVMTPPDVGTVFQVQDTEEYYRFLGTFHPVGGTRVLHEDTSYVGQSVTKDSFRNNNKLEVFLNGILLPKGDYFHTGNEISLGYVSPSHLLIKG